MEHETYSRPTKDEALGLLDTPNLSALMERATILRDAGFGNVVTIRGRSSFPSHSYAVTCVTTVHSPSLPSRTNERI